MIRINQLKLPIRHTTAELEELKLSPGHKLSWQIVKKSIDARKKPDLIYSYTVDVAVEGESSVLKRIHDHNISAVSPKRYLIPEADAKQKKGVRPVIIGAGPAGLFCAYELVLAGLSPIVLERGREIKERTRDVETYWRTGVLDTASNVQFGEGGAGTFSDGKLNTLVKDPVGRNRFVLETFVKFGAPEEILYENKPHIGTDILAVVIENMRHFMQEAGAEFHFSSCVTDIRMDADAVTEVCVNDTDWIAAGCVVLAPGHSARDTFSMLYENQFPMSAKPFAVGFRVEHPQALINRSQYGAEQVKGLGAAAYKVTAKTGTGRGVYSFCMCPGGYVVNASSEPGRLAVNGMSYSGRDGQNANSAIIVSVTPEDYGSEHPLAGIEFQRVLEKKAYDLCNGKLPVQLYGDFRKKVTGEDLPEKEIDSDEWDGMEPQCKGAYEWTDLTGILPEECNHAFVEGMDSFGRQIRGFDSPHAILTGVESRTSSPVRIDRDEKLQSAIRGCYPCGEGAGYAGGITSAAMDGIRVAEMIASQFAPSQR